MLENIKKWGIRLYSLLFCRHYEEFGVVSITGKLTDEDTLLYVKGRDCLGLPVLLAMDIDEVSELVSMYNDRKQYYKQAETSYKF